MFSKSVNLSNSKTKENLFFPTLKIAKGNSDKIIEWINVPTESATTLNTAKEEEVLIVMQGRGGIVVNGLSFTLKAGDRVRVPRNSIRSLANIEGEFLQVISIRYQNI